MREQLQIRRVEPEIVHGEPACRPSIEDPHRKRQHEQRHQMERREAGEAPDIEPGPGDARVRVGHDEAGEDEEEIDTKITGHEQVRER